jgi:hypothetical protein
VRVIFKEEARRSRGGWKEMGLVGPVMSVLNSRFHN